MSPADGDVAEVLARRHDNGADFWATADGRIYVGNPFSTISSLGILYELGVDAGHEAVSGGLNLVLSACRDDGRVRVAPKAPLYPCYTAEAIRVLCRWGLAEREEVRASKEYLLGSTHESGGWRCSFSRFGKGPETELASPGATLYALDVLRFFPDELDRAVARAAVDSLLHHWDVRTPLGPCHHGIGSRFREVEFPFVRYNLFFWVYVLSHFPRARRDARFAEALGELRGHLDEDGGMVIDRPHRGLGKLRAFAKGRASEAATRRYREIARNVAAL